MEKKQEEFSQEQVKGYWTGQAKKHKQSYAASWSDKYAIELEINEISKRLENRDNVLDIGCANGYSTIEFCKRKSINVSGYDYIPEMVEEAKANLKGLKEPLLGSASFGVGNIMKLELKEKYFDKVVCIRVLINLGNWENQKKALKECARVLKKGGLLLLSEATLQGWKNLNCFRREWGLEEIAMPAFNCYLDQEKTIEAAKAEGLELVELANFSSTYFVGTRILKPLIIKGLGVEKNIDASNPDMEFNRWFSQLPSCGDYGTQKLFVFRKK